MKFETADTTSAPDINDDLDVNGDSDYAAINYQLVVGALQQVQQWLPNMPKRAFPYWSQVDGFEVRPRQNVGAQDPQWGANAVPAQRGTPSCGFLDQDEAEVRSAPLYQGV